jgi:phenylacetate-CoA ligase
MLVRKFYYLLKRYRRQWIPADRLLALQGTLLHRLVDHAYRTVPYYRTLFDKAKISPADITSVRDIPKIPISYKEDFQSAPLKNLISTAYDSSRIRSHPTGGSTGQIMDIHFDEWFDDVRAGCQYRTYLANGYRFTDTIANLQARLPKPHILTRFGLNRRVGIPFNLSLEEQLSLLEAVQPQVLEGYPSRIRLIAQTMNDKNLRSISPRLIFTNSETLTGAAREQIIAAFGVNPINVYESWEFGTIAWECPQREGLHINADHVILEAIINGREAPAGEPGEIVGTNLFNYVMPLIRFSTKDCGIKATKACRCGRTLPLLQDILGRASERIISADGTEHIGITALDSVLHRTPGVIEYQCVQPEKGAMDIFIVANDKFTPEVSETLKRTLVDSFRQNQVAIKLVNSIPRTPAGKRITFISKLG